MLISFLSFIFGYFLFINIYLSVSCIQPSRAHLINNRISHELAFLHFGWTADHFLRSLIVFCSFSSLDFNCIVQRFTDVLGADGKCPFDRLFLWFICNFRRFVCLFFLLPLVGLVVALCSVLINFMNVRHFVLVLFRLAKSSRGGFLFSLGFCVEVEHFWKCCQQVWNIPQSYKKREKEIEEIPRRISKILKGKTWKLRQHSASWRREKKGKVMDWLFLKQVTNDTRNPLAPPQPRLPLPPPPSRHANR